MAVPRKHRRHLTAAAVALLLVVVAIALSRYSRIGEADVASAGEDPAAVRVARLDAAEAVIAAGVGTAYPGATFALGQGALIERIGGTGRIGWRAASPPVIADSTLYDLASLTKAMAAAVAVLLLVEDGVIALDDPVRRHLPAFEGENKQLVTWRHLLTHTAGLPPGAAIRGTTDAERLRRILRTRLQTLPGQQVVYSDLGYVVLWSAAERAAGEPLTRLLQRRVWGPLGMTQTRFKPGRDCELCAPTLRLRTGEPFRGEASDLLARRVGGVTGNAGLFSTASDMARFMAAVANGGELAGARILSRASVDALLTQQPGAGRRTLGWTAFCPDEQGTARTPCERPLAFGHTGWAGTSLWLEPASGYWAVLLTNRSYERPNRPFPLEGVRRDLFLHLIGEAGELPVDRWVAAAGVPPRDPAEETTVDSVAP